MQSYFRPMKTPLILQHPSETTARQRPARIAGQLGCVAFLCAIVAAALPAQQPTATISGTVFDTAGVPIRDAEVSVQPGGRTTRSDSTGRFQLTGLAPANYTVTARRLGYSAAQYYVSLRAGGTAELEIILTASTTQLDTVIVSAKGNCPRFSLQGFNCRRLSRDGVFLDKNDIAAKHPEYAGDLFRGIDGIRVEYRTVGRVIRPVPFFQKGWKCAMTIVNGHRLTPYANVVPDSIKDIVAMEIYPDPKKVPEEYRMFAWSPPNPLSITGRRTTTRVAAARPQPSTPCALVVYWTKDAPKRP
jgi:hypothetical protein